MPTTAMAKRWLHELAARPNGGRAKMDVDKIHTASGHEACDSMQLG